MAPAGPAARPGLGQALRIKQFSCTVIGSLRLAVGALEREVLLQFPIEALRHA